MNIINAWKKLVKFPKLTIFIFVLAIILEGCGNVSPEPPPSQHEVTFLLDGNPLPDKDKLLVLCYTAAAPGQLLSGEYEIITDPNETVLPDDCNYLAALYLR